MKQCVSCGRDIIDSAQFCVYCGARQPAGETPPGLQDAGKSGASDTGRSSVSDTGKNGVPGAGGKSTPGAAKLKSAKKQTGTGDQGIAAAEVQEESAGKRRRISVRTLMKLIRKHKLPAAIGAAVIVAAFVLLGLTVSRPAEIDLARYTEVQFSGYNGAGTARVNFDEAAFACDVAKVMAEKGVISRSLVRDAAPESIRSILNSSWEDGSKVELAENGFDYTLDRTQGLSNGDFVKLTYRCNNAQVRSLKIRFVGDEQNIAVAGLDEVGRFDAFAGADITISGPDGYGQAVLSKTGTEDMFMQLEYALDKEQELHNGDTVTVTVTNRKGGTDFSEFGRTYGVIPETTTKTIEVSGLTEYPTFDAFAGLSVSVEGAEPFGYIVLTNLDESNDIWFQADRYDNLSNGDEITVRAVPGYTGAFNAEYAEIYGQVPEKSEITIQIQGLPASGEGTE